MSTFLIIGLTPQGLSMLRILSKAGHHVVAFTNSKKSVGYYSKYGDKRIFKSIEDLKEQILYITKYSREKINCIITSGELLARILTDFHELYEICNVQSGPLSLLKILTHKDQMYDFALSRGMRCAKYSLLSTYEPGTLNFPVILKRNYEIPLFFKIKKIDSEPDLFAFIKKITKEDYNHILVQEYIEDNTAINISYQDYFINDIGRCSFICNQERRLNSGITSYLKEIKDATINKMIINEAALFFKGSGYKGFAELEFLYSQKNKKIYFIEINTRTCGLHSVLNHKFANLSALYNNINNPPEIIENPQLITWINIARDIKARLQTKDFNNLFQFFTAKYDILDWHDLKPFIYQLFK